MMCWSDALPTELHLHQVKLLFPNTESCHFYIISRHWVSWMTISRIKGKEYSVQWLIQLTCCTLWPPMFYFKKCAQPSYQWPVPDIVGSLQEVRTTILPVASTWYCGFTSRSAHNHLTSGQYLILWVHFPQTWLLGGPGCCSEHGDETEAAIAADVKISQRSLGPRNALPMQNPLSRCWSCR